MTGTCVIVGAGNIAESEVIVNPEDYVIGADGGMDYLKRHGIRADMALGDFDSLGYVPEHHNLVVHPVMKDDTDMMLAVKAGLARGYRKFRLYGGLGGRLDHTLANLQTLICLAEQGAEAQLIGEGVRITAIHNGKISFDASHEGIISVFCLSGKAEGVWIRGLKYPVEDVELTSDRPLGVSNEFVGVESEIGVRAGTLIILWNC
ncbi:MAG: thiamine diphosphokinase [Lachnospiraceae bacterium]|nr:thiamine diphosphokinase [Lachnospiraceae bacterium]